MSTNEDYVEIPLRNKAGEIVAYAIIDKKNEEKVNLHTWHDNGDGYREVAPAVINKYNTI